MKVAFTVEVTDQQRNIISRLKNPKATKRLATRHEVRMYLISTLAGLRGIPQSEENRESLFRNN